jgi:two-component system sensor histidine kinase KdpD
MPPEADSVLPPPSAEAPAAAQPPDGGQPIERRANPDRADNADFLALVRQRERGKLKLYIGSSAGTGKSYRMLQEAHDLKRRGIDVVVGFIETHGRTDTDAQIRDIEVVPRQKIEYRGVTLEEMDVDAIIARHPQIAIVDELAHTNVPGASRRKRWEDVVALLDQGVNVISALNVQHLESLNDVIASTLGVTVRETVPDWVVSTADQVVNLDISAEDLRDRLREGKIYRADKIDAALRNFFTDENLTTLRELALREVASSVDRTREAIVRREEGGATAAQRPAVDRVLVAMSSKPAYTAALLRKASRIAGRLNSDWYCVYVQTPEESADRIDSAVQRKLVDNIQLAQSMGAEVVKLQGNDVAEVIAKFAREKGVTLLIVGQSRQSGLRHLFRGSLVHRLVNNTQGLDILVASFDANGGRTSSGGARSP